MKKEPLNPLELKEISKENLERVAPKLWRKRETSISVVIKADQEDSQ